MLSFNEAVLVNVQARPVPLCYCCNMRTPERYTSYCVHAAFFMKNCLYFVRHSERTRLLNV